MSGCLQNRNGAGGGNPVPAVTLGDRPTLIAFAALVVLLHGGLAFWLGRAVVKPLLLKEKVLEISMVSVAAPKSAQQAAAAAASADKVGTQPATKQPPPVTKALAAKVPVPPAPKKTTPAKPKPVIKEPLPTPVIPAPVSPPSAPPPVNQAATHADVAAPAPANTTKASPPANQAAADNGTASKAAAGNPVACVACPQPDYPAAARRHNMQGVVQLKLELSAEGSVVNVTVLQSSGHELLDEAAVADVREWQFAPGPPGVTRTATQRITFKM